MTEILDKAKQWLSSTFDAETQQEIQQLIDTNLTRLSRPILQRHRIWNWWNERCHGCWN